jgi:hypothetical protein
MKQAHSCEDQKMTLLHIVDERATEDFVPEYLLRPITATEGGVWIPASEIDPDDLEPASRAALWQAIAFDTDDEVRRQRRLEDALGDGRIICERCGATLATYADVCPAEIGALCPGLLAMDKVGFGN